MGGADIPESPGVYAWYYKPILSDRDIKTVELSLSGKSPLEKEPIYQQFLQHFLLDFYKEDSYIVSISGALKPSYSGNLEHVNQASASLIKKLIDSKLTLTTLKNILLDMDEGFLSPIYIGMARNISSRINQHKRMIKNDGDYTNNSLVYRDEADAFTRDSCFAERVISRKYVTSGMFVVVKETESHNAVENILNRINYPILGRN